MNGDSPSELHPKAAAFLQQVNEAGAPQMGDDIRIAREAADMMMLAAWGGDIASATMCEIDADLPGRRLPLRIYRPATATPNEVLPVAFCCHGGGFLLGSIGSFDPWARELCVGAEICVISIGYRKPPEHPFPIPVEDCYDAVCWSLERSNDLRINRSHVALAGVSAGGALAAATALMARDRSHPKIAIQYLEMPCLDARMRSQSYREFATGHFVTRADMEKAWAAYAPHPADRDNPYVSPLLAEDLSGVAPAYILVAEFDPMRDDGVRFAARLREAGVPATLAVARGHLHCLTGFRAHFADEAAAMQQPAFRAIGAALREN